MHKLVHGPALPDLPQPTAARIRLTGGKEYDARGEPGTIVVGGEPVAVWRFTLVGPPASLRLYGYGGSHALYDAMGLGAGHVIGWGVDAGEGGR